MHHDIVCKITGAGARREFSILPPPPTLHPIFRSVVGFLIPFARSVSGRRSRSVSTKRNEFDYVDSSGFVWYPDTRLLELTIPWTSLWRLNLSRRRRRVRRSATRALVLGSNDCSLVGSWSLYSGPIWSAVSSYSISIDSRHCRTSRINAGSISIFSRYTLFVSRRLSVSERLSVHLSCQSWVETTARSTCGSPNIPTWSVSFIQRVARSIIQSGGKESFDQIRISLPVPLFCLCLIKSPRRRMENPCCARTTYHEFRYESSPGRVARCHPCS